MGANTAGSPRARLNALARQGCDAAPDDLPINNHVQLPGLLLLRRLLSFAE
jgi:hypothetical protein